MKIKKGSLYLPLLMRVALVGMYGCASIDNGLKQQIAEEAKLLQPAVEDSEAIEKVALEVVDNKVSYSKSTLLKDSKLEDYIVIALERNPSIHRKIRDIEALGFKVNQVTSLEDPMFSLTPPTGSMTQTTAGMVGTSLGAYQQIPFPGKLTKRGVVAEQEVRMAFASLSDLRIQLAAEVARGYYDFYLVNVSIKITEESQELLKQIRDVAYARYQAGEATQQDVLRAEVEIYVLMNELLTLQQQKISAQAKLNTLMSYAVDTELPAPKALELEVVELKLPELLDQAVKINPKLNAAKEQIKRDLEGMKLAQLSYYPDLRLGFGYSFIGSGISPVANGNDIWSVPIGLNLPIWWQRINAEVNASNARTLSSIEQYEEMKNMLFYGIQDSLTKIDTQYRQAKLFKDLILPTSKQAVTVSTANYRAGDIEFTALVENWRNWLKLSLEFHKTLAGLEQRFADLRQFVGADLQRVSEDIPASPNTNNIPELNSADQENKITRGQNEDSN